MTKTSAEHGTPSRWRAGCHCDACRAAHNADLQQTRRAATVERLEPTTEALLSDLEAGVPLTAACRILGVSLGLVQGRGRWDTEWQRRLDAALMAGRDPTLDHGTEGAYRRGHCRCPECRAGRSR